MIYIIVFILSLVFISIALNFRNKNKIIFIFISTIALFIPAALAGLRNYNIGTDVNVYIEPLFSVAKHFNSFKIYITSTGSEINDILYLLMTFICRKLTEDIFLLFFTTQLLVIYPIYKALIIINKNKISILIGMFIYFMLFYNVSLNMARQSIAISFSLLSFAHFITDNKKKSILNLIIACGFHSSATIMIPSYILYDIFKKTKNNKKLTLGIELLITLVIFFIIFFLPEIIKLLIHIGMLDAIHFSKILNKFSKFDINYIRTLYYLIFYLLISLNKNKFNKKIENNNFYIFLSFISIFILQLGAVIKYSERIGLYYFYIPLFFIIPKIVPSNFKKYQKNDLLNLLIIILIFIAYWIYWIIIVKSNETYPFIFR